MEHTDAPNSYLRSIDRKELIPRLLRDAPDMLWMAESILARHGQALRTHGPSQFRETVRQAAVHSLLTGNRRKGLRYGIRYVRVARPDAPLLATLAFGLLGRQVLAHVILLFRIIRVVRRVPPR
jgi:hypothetical protein